MDLRARECYLWLMIARRLSTPLARALVFLLVCSSIEAAAPANALPVPPANEILARLRTAHPRLLVSADEFAALRQRTTTNAVLRDWRRTLTDRGARMLDQAPSTYEIPDGLRLLSTSRRVVDRVYTLALLFRLDGEARYAERAWRELEAAAAFPDWNPRHFLDTAEMTHAFAIGYDWLYDLWTPRQRGLLREAMVEKGLKPALEIYRRNSGWPRARHNWNQVCNGGIGLGALALADVEAAASGEILEAALRSLQLPMREYGPDGAWAEGPGYWRYATQYNVVFLAALESALGTDFGLGDLPGFREAGLFPIYLTGPLGRTFNYADGGDGAIRSPEMFWLARRFGLPVYAAYEQRLASPQALDLVWFRPESLPPETTPLPLDRYFRGAEVVTIRSDWDKRDAFFLGFKGGDNQANHSHLDLGTFVLDALGVRWAVDLGADDYNLPAYFGNQRWTYYRLRAEGHNTIALNPATGPDQDPSAAAKVLKFTAASDRALAVTDLSAAYARHAQSVQRGVMFLDRQGPRPRVLVQDEVVAATPADFWWFLHTPAAIELAPDGRSATLSREGQRLHAALLDPAPARFTVMDARPLPGTPAPDRQNPNDGIRKLAIHLPAITDLRLRVLLQPVTEAPGDTPSPTAARPLTEW